MSANKCSKCGYVKGATIGFPPLAQEERTTLSRAGFDLDTNACGEEIARPTGRQTWYTARFCLHKTFCCA